jgi:hypothetical protein
MPVPVAMLHTMPQPPQLFESVVVVTQTVLQSVPEEHPQELEMHDSPPEVLHACPQDPQLFESVLVVVQTPLQLVVPLPHAAQVPPLQVRRSLKRDVTSAALSTRL